MAGQTFRVALAASGTATPLAGTLYEDLPYDALVEFGLQADATGVLASISSGTDILMEEGPVQVGTINVQPKYPDDFYVSDVGAAGDKLIVRLRDTSGAARVVMVAVKITPIS